MNRKVGVKRILLLLMWFTLCASAIVAQTTSFTYQGRLTDGDTPANGSYDLRFALFDSATGGAQIGATQTLNAVPVNGGIFTVMIDFGANAFPGANRFLEIGARLTGLASFITLSPRQQVSYTPYAIHSLNASSADTVPVSGVPSGSGNYIQNTTTQQTGANFNIGGNGVIAGALEVGNSKFKVDNSGKVTAPSVITSNADSGLSGFALKREEPTPPAPTVAQITDGTGACTAGMHVFAVVFNTTTGSTNASAVSSPVVCDGAHTKVVVTLPEEKTFVVSRDVYVSKANTTSPLYLVSASPMVNWPNANPDNNLSNDYIFSTADNSLTTTVAPTTNTAIDPAYTVGSDGQIKFGSGPPQSISSSVAWQVNDFGSINMGIFQRFDPGEARVTAINGGITAPDKFNYPTFALINPGITVGANSAVSYTPLQGNSVIGTFNVRGTYKSTAPAFSCSGCVGFDWLTTENWSQAGTGVKLKVRLMKTGFDNIAFIPLAIDSVSGSVFTGTTADGTTYAMQVVDTNSASLFTIRDDGRIGIGTTTPLAKLDIAGTLKLDVLAGAGDEQLCRNSMFHIIATCSSSLRYKRQIAPYNAGLEVIKRLRPISFAWKANGGRDLGLGAEDVANVEPLMVTHNDKGEIEGVKYDHLTVVLINAIKQQQEQIARQQLQIEQLQQQRNLIKLQEARVARQQKQIASLKKLICLNHPRAVICK